MESLVEFWISHHSLTGFAVEKAVEIVNKCMNNYGYL